MAANIIVILAVYHPDPDYLAEQFASFARQTRRPDTVLAVIADLVSGGLVEKTARDAGVNLQIYRPDTSLDAVRAFETGLAEAVLLAGDQSETFVALADQDDIWHPGKLRQGLEALRKSGADLIHSDARLVAEDGATVIAGSMFSHERRVRNAGLRGLLYRNNITGMTILMRLNLARLSLPFPAQSGIHFYHDLWLGLLASATGGVCVIDQPLVDYRQHGNNTIGAINRGTRWRSAKLPNKMWLRREAAGYGLARYLANSVNARVSDLIEDGIIQGDQARVSKLRPYLNKLWGFCTHALDSAGLFLRGHFDLARTAAAFSIVSLGRTVWVLHKTWEMGHDAAREKFDTNLYSLAPGVNPKSPRTVQRQTEKAFKTRDRHKIIDHRKVPRWIPEFTAGIPAFTVLVPTLNPTEIFAGVATAVDIGLGLAKRGVPVRFIATDLPVSSPATSRAFLLGRLGMAGGDPELRRRVSLHCGVNSDQVPAHKGDIYMATAWWTAYLANHMIRKHGLRQHRFHYLIQDYEPNFYPWGPEFADAMASYKFDFDPIFNTILLRDWFAEQGAGFAGETALSFHSAIDISRYANGHRPVRHGPKRLAVYGRPEVPRNMFPTAVETLSLFIEKEQLTPQKIEIVSIGMIHETTQLPMGLTLKSLGKLPWEDYPKYLLQTDLGLSLMYSPHPSHPPLEMAASGVRVVVNEFGPKDLGRLTPAILSAEATAPALAQALSDAWHMGPVAETARRIDLRELGAPPEDVIDKLAASIKARLS